MLGCIGTWMRACLDACCLFVCSGGPGGDAVCVDDRLPTARTSCVTSQWRRALHKNLLCRVACGVNICAPTELHSDECDKMKIKYKVIACLLSATFTLLPPR